MSASSPAKKNSQDGSSRVGWTSFAAIVAGGIFLPLLFGGLVLGGDRHWREEAVLAVCAGIIASAVWWAIFSRYAEAQGKHLLTRELRAQHRILDTELQKLRRMLEDEIDKEARRRNESSVPRDIYRAIRDFDLRFNRDLDRDLSRSSFYFFSGPTGVYVPARIMLRSADAPNRLEDVRLIIVDPTAPLVMKRAVRDRARRDLNSEKSPEEISEEIKRDLLLTHVALWECRSKVYGTIRIAYEGESVASRLELFDGAVYDSDIDRNDKEDFPPTAAWRRSQPTWVEARNKFAARGLEEFIISPTTSAEELESHLEEFELMSESLHSARERYMARYFPWMSNGLKKARDVRDGIDPMIVSAR